MVRSRLRDSGLRDAALPLTKVGGVAGHAADPARRGLHVEGRDDRHADLCCVRIGRARVGEDDLAEQHGIDGEVVLGRISARKAGKIGLVQAAAGVSHGDRGVHAAVNAVMQRGRSGDERVVLDADLDRRRCGRAGVDEVGRERDDLCGKTDRSGERECGVGGDNRVGLRALRDVGPMDFNGPDARCRGVDADLLDVVQMVLNRAGRECVGRCRRECPREGASARRAVHPHVEVVDERGDHVRRARSVVPRGSKNQRRRAGCDGDGVEVHEVLAELALGRRARAKQINRGVRPDRPVPELVVGTDIAKVRCALCQQHLERRVPRPGRAGPQPCPILQEERRDARRGRCGHRGAAVDGVGVVARAAATGHTKVAAALTSRRAKIGLEATIVGGSPAAEAGHRIIVGVHRSDRKMVLRARRRPDRTEAAGVAPTAALVARRPDDSVGHASRHALAAADNGVDNAVGHPVVPVPTARKAVVVDIGADRVVGDIRALAESACIVGLDIARVGVQPARAGG